MKFGIMICFLLTCTLACNTAMKSGAKTEMLKAGAPNTATLSNGEVVYDLSGEWEAVTTTGCGGLFKGTMKITQDGNQFVGILQNGDYPHSTPQEKVKGTLQGAGIVKSQFYAIYGWGNSYAEISNAGNEIAFEAPLSDDCRVASTTLKRK